MSDSVLAWHFSDGELRFDYAGVKVEAGLVLETEEKPVVEKNGFHASIRALDALRWYAVRPQTEFMISRVRLSGEIVESRANSWGAKRLIAQKREHLWVADAKDALEEFSLFIQHLIRNIVIIDSETLAIIAWIYPEYHGFELFIDKSLVEKMLGKILNRRLKYRVLDCAKLLSDIQKDLLAIKIWQKAREDSFDLPQYLKQNKDNYMGVAIINVRHWLLKHPPMQYKAAVVVPKDPNERFHEMLMRLAPDGYEE